MKTHRTSADADKIRTIVQIIRALRQNNDRKKYSSSLEFALADLVRDEMRSIAQRERRFPRSADLLGVAIERVTGTIEKALDGENIGVDLNKYIAKVRTTLTYPAKEIQCLGEKLAESRHIDKLGAKQDVIAESGCEFVVHELGLREAIQGLLVEPAEQCQEINVDVIRDQRDWRVEGEWFPYEVFAEEFVFVIDDDGSIFVSTRNLPPELRQKANRLLRQLAELLFT